MPDTIKSISVTSLWEFLRTVAEIENQWDADERRPFQKWFRGQSDSRWSLIPGMYRANGPIVSEDACRNAFALRAHPYLAGSAREPQTDWDWYFVMQHHGLPTRLLDWSESPLVALYFALREVRSGRTPAIWMLDPWSLNNNVAGVGDLVIQTPDAEAQDYLPPCYSDIEYPVPPIALAAPFHSRRITAQKGTFTLHGTSTRAIDKYSNVRMAKIEIHKTVTDTVRRDLARAGITETTVFPELSGLARELLDYWSGR